MGICNPGVEKTWVYFFKLSDFYLGFSGSHDDESLSTPLTRKYFNCLSLFVHRRGENCGGAIRCNREFKVKSTFSIFFTCIFFLKNAENIL